MQIKDLVIIGMLGALLIAVQVGLAFLPNVELVTLFIIIYTIHLRKKAPYIITIFILIEGFLYGFGLWWINYLYIWFILYIIVQIFQKERSSFFWAIISGAYGLSFGALCSIPYFFMGINGNSLINGLHSAFAYWISGIPFDLIHGFANFIITLILFKPLFNIMEQLTKSRSIFLEK